MEEEINGVRKKISELKEGSLFVFTNRKKMPCIFNGIAKWNYNNVYLWSELKEHGSWTQNGSRWVIDYDDYLPDDLHEKREAFLDKH